MFRKFASLSLSILMILTFVFSLGVPAFAATERAVKSGTMQDTSNPNNGVITWTFSYDRSDRTASLTITGEGYMPNDTDTSWFTIQSMTQCYITKLTIGEGVKSIMNSAFAYEERLTSVTLPESLEIIGEGAFAYSGVTSLNIPKNVKSINEKMFIGSSIKKFTVDSENPYYTAKNGDIYSKDMTTFVASAPAKFQETGGVGFEFPSSVKTIAPFAFYMSGVREIIIPSNILEIKNMAFSGSSLQKIHIDSGLQSIYNSAFLKCEKLTEVALPSTVTFLGYYSLGYTYKLDTDGVASVLDELGISHSPITEYNCETYLSQASSVSGLVYSPEHFMYCAPDENFTLYSSTGSLGQQYASRNLLNFEAKECTASRVYYAEPCETGVQIKWIKSVDAEGYRILHKDEFEDWRVLATVKGNETFSYTDKAPYEDFPNEYTVVAYNSKGDAFFDDVGVSCNYVKPPVLKDISISNTSKGIKLTWEYTGVADYVNIYRKNSKGEWTRISRESTDSDSYTDKTVKNGTKYYYKIQLVRKGAVGGKTEKELSYISIAMPSKVTVSNTTSGVKVSWNKCGGTEKYYIYRKKKGAKSWTRIEEVSKDKLSYTDKTAKSGTTYYYTVRAYNGKYKSSFLESGKAIIYLSTPQNKGIKSTKSGVQIKYTRSSGAEGYYIYRKQSGSSYKKIATVKGEKALSYTDKSAKKGKTYTYTVRAYKGNYKSNYIKSGQKIKDRY